MEIKALQKPVFKYIHMFVTSPYNKSVAWLYLHYSP